MIFNVFVHLNSTSVIVIKVFPFRGKVLIVFLLIIFIIIIFLLPPLVPLWFATCRIDIWSIIYCSRLVSGSHHATPYHVTLQSYLPGYQKPCSHSKFKAKPDIDSKPFAKWSSTLSGHSVHFDRSDWLILYVSYLSLCILNYF